MLFNSYIFILLFLPVCVLGYYALNHWKWRDGYIAGQIFLLTMSFWFYAYFNINYLFVILGSIVMNYAICVFLWKVNQGGYEEQYSLWDWFST